MSVDYFVAWNRNCLQLGKVKGELKGKELCSKQLQAAWLPQDPGSWQAAPPPASFSLDSSSLCATVPRRSLGCWCGRPEWWLQLEAPGPLRGAPLGLWVPERWMGEGAHPPPLDWWRGRPRGCWGGRQCWAQLIQRVCGGEDR